MDQTAVAMRVYAEHRAFYDKLQANVARAAGPAVTDPDAALALVGAAAHANALVGSFKPAVILISGCQDNQTSMDGEHNGAFTEQLLKAWRGGKFVGNELDFAVDAFDVSFISNDPFNAFDLARQLV